MSFNKPKKHVMSTDRLAFYFINKYLPRPRAKKNQ